MGQRGSERIARKKSLFRQDRVPVKPGNLADFLASFGGVKRSKKACHKQDSGMVAAFSILTFTKHKMVSCDTIGVENY